MTTEQRDHLNRLRVFVPLAEEQGVPGAVMIAQATIESGWGRSGLAKKAHAYFGVKAHGGWTGKVYSGTTREWEGGRSVTYGGTNEVYASKEAALTQPGVREASLFRAYDTFEENIRDYLEFFRRNLRYHNALARYAVTKDPRRFARDIHQAGYATSPTYSQTLIDFMEQVIPDLLPTPGPEVPPSVKPVTIRVFTGSQPVELAGQAVLVDGGRVYVHARTLADVLGLQTDYDAATRTVNLRAKEG